MREQRDERQMNSKNYTDVLIGGKIYTLGGAEETGYLQQVAAYINEKIDALESQEGIRRQSEDYRHMVLCLNLADDCFKARENARVLAAQKEELEKEIYRLKHELVSTQLKMEALQTKQEKKEK
ncbi:MAG: cell division protein ZapA [Clostridium sp.]|nr:cell division protein ZapA [Clostridium sp.]